MRAHDELPWTGRSVKRASVVVAALLGVALFAGAAPAGAESVLCEANTGENACPTIDTSPPGIAAASTKASFTLGELKFACASELKTAAAPEGEAFGEETTTLSFASCGEGCSVKAGNLPYATSLSSLGTGDGTISMASEPLLTITCGAAECVYGSSSIAAEALGGEPASILAKTSLPKKKGNTALCTLTASLEALYSVSSPNPTWVEEPREDRTVLCDIAEEKCPEEGEHIYPEPTLTATLVPETEAVFQLNLVTDTCSVSNLELSVSPLGEQYARQISVAGMEFSSCVGTLGACAFKSVGLPYSGSLEASGGGDGTLRLQGGEGRFLEFFCGGFSKCFYSPAVELIDGLEGGSPAHVHVDVFLKRFSGGCPEKAHWTADYEVIAPSGGLFTEVVYP